LHQSHQTIRSENKIIKYSLTYFMFRYKRIVPQEPCKVLKQEIATKYFGNCKKGLAQGKGVAVGRDKYEGQFKNGLPNGKENILGQMVRFMTVIGKKGEKMGRVNSITKRMVWIV